MVTPQNIQSIPFGPSVTLTAFASTSTPANMLARPSLENLTSLCAYRRETRVADERPTTRRATLVEDWERWCIVGGGKGFVQVGGKQERRGWGVHVGAPGINLDSLAPTHGHMTGNACGPHVAGMCSFVSSGCADSLNSWKIFEKLSPLARQATF